MSCFISLPETYHDLVNARLPFGDIGFGIHGFPDFWGQNENRSSGPKNGLLERLAEAKLTFGQEYSYSGVKKNQQYVKKKLPKKYQKHYKQKITGFLEFPNIRMKLPSGNRSHLVRPLHSFGKSSSYPFPIRGSWLSWWSMSAKCKIVLLSSRGH